MKRFNNVILFFALLALCSCDRGYDVRFVNYYLEPMDSVLIGENKIVFLNVDLQQTTDFKKISKGSYSVKLISKSKKMFKSNIVIPKNGTGQRTIQIDAIQNISILEE